MFGGPGGNCWLLHYIYNKKIHLYSLRCFGRRTKKVRLFLFQSRPMSILSLDRVAQVTDP
jgi:hypothetical protein